MKKRMSWLDIAKGIAILMVVVGHVNLIPWEPYRKIIFSFHMPLFFIAAGYTTKDVFSWKTIKKLIGRLLIPYAAACVLVGIVRILQGSDLPTELVRMLWGSGVVADYGPGLPITGAESIPVTGAIWFLPCMFFAKIIFGAFLTVTKTWKEWLKAPIVLILCACGYIIGQHYKLPLCIDVALFSVIFLYAGYLLKKYNGIGKKSVTAGAVCLGLWFLALRFNALELSARLYREFPYCIFTVLGAIAACYFIFHVSEEVLDKIKGVKHLLVYCGKYSMELLLLHFLDGKVWHSSWFMFGLPERLGLSGLKQGCVTALCQIVIYLAICGVYTTCRYYVEKGIRKRKALTTVKTEETP